MPATELLGVIRVGAHDGERRFEVVRQGGDLLALAFLGLPARFERGLERCAHLLHGVEHVAHLAHAACADGEVELLGAHVVGDVDERLEGAREHAARASGDERDGDNAAGAAHDEQEVLRVGSAEASSGDVNCGRYSHMSTQRVPSARANAA